MIVKSIIIVVSLAGGPPQVSIADATSVDACVEMMKDILKHPPSDFGAKVLSVACHVEENAPS